jgi:iron complex transport system permease protein
MLVGWPGGLAGATFQGLLRNPLADPYVLGTASGAARRGDRHPCCPVQPSSRVGLLHGLAFVGALASAWLVFRLGGSGGPGGLTRLLLDRVRRRLDPDRAADHGDVRLGDRAAQIFSFLLGGLGASWSRLAVATPLIIARRCDRIARAPARWTGCSWATPRPRHLGIDVKRERGILLALASLATAAGVAIAGLIGFVGLSCPTSCAWSRARPLAASCRSPPSRVRPPDRGGPRRPARRRRPVGVVDGAPGAPFFLFLLHRSRSGYEL